MIIITILKKPVCLSFYGGLFAQIYTAVQKFGIRKNFNIFKEVSSAHQGCIYLIKNTEKQ